MASRTPSELCASWRGTGDDGRWKKPCGRDLLDVVVVAGVWAATREDEPKKRGAEAPIVATDLVLVVAMMVVDSMMEVCDATATNTTNQPGASLPLIFVSRLAHRLIITNLGASRIASHSDRPTSSGPDLHTTRAFTHASFRPALPAS